MINEWRWHDFDNGFYHRQGFPAYHSVESIHRISDVLDNSSSTVSFDETVAATDDVTVSTFVLALRVTR
jgi:hypothetical protein